MRRGAPDPDGRDEGARIRKPDESPPRDCGEVAPAKQRGRQKGQAWEPWWTGDGSKCRKVVKRAAVALEATEVEKSRLLAEYKRSRNALRKQSKKRQAPVLRRPEPKDGETRRRPTNRRGLLEPRAEADPDAERPPKHRSSYPKEGKGARYTKIRAQRRRSSETNTRLSARRYSRKKRPTT